MQRFRKRRFKQNKVHSNNPRDNLFYRIFDRLPLPIFIINNNCSIFYKNKEAVKIILESRNKSARNLKHLFVNPEDKQKLINSLTSSSKSLENIKIPLSISVDGSNSIKVNCLISPIIKNRNVKFVILFEDITYLKQIEKQLIHSQKMEIIGMFTGSIAHDFNNMLTAIIGYTDFLMESYKERDALHNYMLEIKKAGEKAASLSKQLLKFTRKQELNSETIDLNAVLNDMRGMIKKLIGEKVTLKIIPDETPCYIKTDRSHIEQIIMNLVINARDAMPDGGSIEIEVKSMFIDSYYSEYYSLPKSGPYVLLAISDTGVGIDDEIKKNIFEPFFTTKEKGRGTGLGLSTVQSLVKQWDGSIFVDSKPNNGTTFKIFLPQTTETPKPINYGYSIDQNLEGSETILLVEDDKTVRGLIKHTFTAYGYNVIEASNPRKTIDLIESYDKDIDLLITDIVMPEMNGNELASFVISKYPDIKVIYISGYMDSSYSTFIKDKASHIFLQKPLKPAELLKETRELLNKAEENTVV